MRKIALFLLACMLSAVQVAYAQRTITGAVTSSEDGKGIPSVSIVVKGTTTGVVTNVNGNYTLNVPANATTLVFSFIGMRTQEIAIAGRNVINVVMEPTAEALDEVVVMAYGTATRGTFTGSATVVGSQKIESRPISNISRAIEGQTPGVQVTSGSGQPGAGQDIRIRGFGSVNFSNAPLYVVDGAPYDYALSNLNPADIESITILKDAAATALYGNRAANGVIMVTTKRGNKDRSTFTVRATQGFSTRGLDEYELIGEKDYYPVNWESYRNSLAYSRTINLPLADASKVASGTWGNRNASGLQVYSNTGLGIPNTNFNDIFQNLLFNPYNIDPTQIMLENGTLNPAATLIYTQEDLDWEKQLLRLGDRKEFNVTFSGGSQKSDHYVSLGYLDDKGYLIESDFKRFTGRINMNSQLKSWFKTGFNLAANRSQSQSARDGSSTGFVNPFRWTRSIGPIYPIWGVYQFGNTVGKTPGTYAVDDYGNKIFDWGQIAGIPNRASGASPGRHAVAETLWNDDLFTRNVINAKTYGEFRLMEGLALTFNFSLDVNAYNSANFDNRFVGDGSPAGRSSRTNSLSTTNTNSQLLSYKKNMGKHGFDFLTGHENYSYKYEYFYGFRQDIILDGNTELVNFTTTNSLTSYVDNYRLESYLGRVNYDFDGKYLLSGSFRRDGSSRFYKDNRWGNFFSFGLGWRIDKEKFLAKQAWINMAKLRASYGQVGSDALGGGSNYYAWQALYLLGRNNATEPGMYQSKLESRDLKWESNHNWGVGLDFGFFNRMVGTIEYFNRSSLDLLFDVPLPISSGITSELKNVGSVENRGIEFRLGTDIIQKKNFTWNIDVNFTKFTNEIKKMPLDKDGKPQEIISGTKKLMVGKGIYDYWLRVYKGVDPADGAALYAWDRKLALTNIRVFDKDTLTTNPSHALYDFKGSAIPDLLGGFTNSFKYRNLELTVLLSWQLGGYVYDSPYASLMSAGNYGGSYHVDILNRWQKPGDKTDVPRLDAAQTSNFGAGSTRWLIDASYLNVRAVNLYYDLPKSLAQKLTLQRAKAYFSAENLRLFSKRRGMDVNQAFSGVPGNFYQPARIFTFGLDLSL